MSRRSNGDGSITQRTDGRWQVALMQGGVRKTVYAKTEREARRKLREMRRQAATVQSLPNPGNRTVNDLLDFWLEVSKNSLKTRTWLEYNKTCTCHIRPSLGSVKLSQLGPEHVQRLYSSLEAEKWRRVPSMVHALLHRACEMATLWRWLPSNPCARVIKPGHKPQRKDVWSVDSV